MSAYVALLRAVNVGGHAPLSMAELRRSLEGLGLRKVHTYLQSGNVVFDSDDAPRAAVTAAIEARIERDFQTRVGVRVLSASEITQVVAANPFAAAPGADEKALHATFVIPAASESDFGPASEKAFGAVLRTAFDELALPAAEGEEAAFVGPPTFATPVVYLQLPHGYGRTKLNNAYFERALGTAATTRNWRTIRTLAELSSGSGRA
jgi:uncharacterized protein (DUF1697 family)